MKYLSRGDAGAIFNSPLTENIPAWELSDQPDSSSKRSVFAWEMSASNGVSSVRLQRSSPVLLLASHLQIADTSWRENPSLISTSRWATVWTESLTVSDFAGTYFSVNRNQDRNRHAKISILAGRFSDNASLL